jgi:hypothetical protein
MLSDMIRDDARERLAKHFPSNRLYRNEVGNPIEALNLVVAQCREELRFNSDLMADDEEWAAGLGAQQDAGLKAMIAAAERCHSEYAARVQVAARALFAEWAASEDEDVRAIGEACRDEDYSSLAI